MSSTRAAYHGYSGSGELLEYVGDMLGSSGSGGYTLAALALPGGESGEAVRPATFIDDSPELVDAKKGKKDHHNKGHGNGHGHGRKGDWQTVEGAGYGGEYSYVVADGRSEPSATWTLEGLEPGKTYQVLVTWVADPANASSTTWTIADGSGGGVLLSISDVDQTELRADATLGGQTWQSLAIVTATSGAMVVRLDAAGSSGRVVADAVQLREIAPTVEYHYDGLGRLMSETDALGRTASYTYDGAGNLTSVTDANGDTVSLAYDAEGRSAEPLDSSGMAGPPNPRTDPAGYFRWMTIGPTIYNSNGIPTLTRYQDWYLWQSGDFHRPYEPRIVEDSRHLTAEEKAYLKPYIPQVDLDNAVIHKGEMPEYTPSWAVGIARGNDIYFRDPQQSFWTPEDMALLAHELVHVGQYRNGMNAASYIWSIRKGYRTSPHEVAAYKLGSRVRNDLRQKFGTSLP